MSPRRSTVTAARRKRIWARTSNTGSPAASSSTSINILGTFETAYSATAILGATVSRIRGTFRWYSTGTLDAAVDLAAGIQVMGTADQATPSGDEFDHWMWYRREGWRATYLSTGNAVVTSQVQPLVWEIDCKAMRKMEELDDNLYFVLDNGTGNPGSYYLDLSVLVLLP